MMKGLYVLCFVIILQNIGVIQAVSITKSNNSPGTFSRQEDGTSKYVVADPGDDVTIICTERIDPNEANFELIWRKDGRAIFNSAEEYTISLPSGAASPSLLTIHSVSEEDEGTYRCSIGSNDDFVYIFVSDPAIPVVTNEPPKIVFLSADVKTILGGDALLQCAASGNPAPIIQWRRPNQDLVLQTGRNQLMISPVTANDRGAYECTAANGFGETKRVVRVDVTDYNYPPIVNALNNVVGVKEGIRAAVRCNATSSPRVEEQRVQWLYEGVQVSQLEQFATATNDFLRLASEWDIYEETVLSVLTIPDVTEDKIGRYTCQFGNDYGYGTANVALEFVKEESVDLTDGSSKKKSTEGGINVAESNIDGSSIGGNECVKPRRTQITDLGTPCLFRGWVDVQGQGASNDYCRVVSTGGQQFLSCALAGSTVDHQYTSPNASSDWFDAGHTDTWYMTDKDGDGRDDYCRCVGVPPNTMVSCMKAEETGFLSHDDFQIQGTAECHYDKVNPFFGTS